MGMENFYNSMLGVLSFFALIFLFRLAISIISYVRYNVSSVKDQIKSKTRTGTGTANQGPATETESPDYPQEMVYDEVCATEIPKHNSYIVVVDDVYHYFCSWECRQKFVDSLNQSSSNKQVE